MPLAVQDRAAKDRGGSRAGTFISRRGRLPGPACRRLVSPGGEGGATGTAMIACSAVGQPLLGLKVNGLSAGTYDVGFDNGDRGPVIVGEIIVSLRGEGTIDMRLDDCPIGRFTEMFLLRDGNVVLQGALPSTGPQ